MITILSFSCAEKAKEERSKTRSEKFIFDHSEFLNEIERNSLQIFLDSLNQVGGVNFVYNSVDNFEKVNADSLAVEQFEKLSVGESGVLIFLSRGNATVKILVGKETHKTMTNDELTRITSEMLPYFKAKDFYGGIKFACQSISNKLQE